VGRQEPLKTGPGWTDNRESLGVSADRVVTKAGMNMTWRARLAIGIAVIAAFSAGASTASSQSLADAARLEEARRKAIKAPVKIYTNDNLVSIPGETIPTPPGPSLVTSRPADSSVPPVAEAPEAAPTPAATPEVDPAKTPEYWRKRIGEAREQRDRNKVYLEALQSRINGLWADFTARDDPAQRAVVASERQRAIDEQARLTKDQQDLEKRIVAIEEEARRAGVPAGWLR
jgi:hypothetical protein